MDGVKVMNADGEVWYRLIDLARQNAPLLEKDESSKLAEIYRRHLPETDLHLVKEGHLGVRGYYLRGARRGEAVSQFLNPAEHKTAREACLAARMASGAAKKARVNFEFGGQNESLSIDEAQDFIVKTLKENERLEIQLLAYRRQIREMAQTMAATAVVAQAPAARVVVPAQRPAIVASAASVTPQAAPSSAKPVTPASTPTIKFLKITDLIKEMITSNGLNTQVHNVFRCFRGDLVKMGAFRGTVRPLKQKVWLIPKERAEDVHRLIAGYRARGAQSSPRSPFRSVPTPMPVQSVAQRAA